MRTGGPDFNPSPIASRKKARTCSKCRATSRPLRSPAVVNSSLSKIAGEAVARFAAAEWHIPTAILRMGAYFGLESGGPAVELVDRVARGKDIWVHPGRPN